MSEISSLNHSFALYLFRSFLIFISMFGLAWPFIYLPTNLILYVNQA